MLLATVMLVTWHRLDLLTGQAHWISY